MEAATSSGQGLLTRDGGVPAAPSGHGAPSGHPIDGDARCHCCSRFPLVGEVVVRHRGPEGAGWVCESCERAGRGKRIGPAVDSERIRSLGGALNVRRAH